MKQILYKLFEHQYLGRDEARTILQNIAQGKYNDVQVASLITVFLMRNISVEELCGFRDALLEMRIPVDLSDFAPIDIVGTGGDGKNTFNISSAEGKKRYSTLFLVAPVSFSGGATGRMISLVGICDRAVLNKVKTICNSSNCISPKRSAASVAIATASL